MKRYVMMVVSVVLIIASLMYLPENVNPAVVAGAGDGENSEIPTADELKSLMDFINGRNLNVASVDSVSDNRFASAEITSGNSAKKHTSATMHNDSYLSSSTTHKIIESINEFGEPVYKNVGNTKVKLNRTLTIYMTDKDTYYVSKGSMTTTFSDFEEKDNSYESVFDFDMQIYVGAENCYMKFNKFKMTKDGESVIDASKVMGKWVKIPPKAAEEMLGVIDSANRSAFQAVQEYVDGGLKSFDKNGNKYTYTTSWLEEDDTEFVVDLSEVQTPFISMIVDGSNDSGSMDLQDKITFTNIDNTVINVDFGDVEVLSMEEFEKIMGGDM